MTPSVFNELTPREKLEIAESFYEFTQTRGYEVIFNELEQRLFTELKIHGSDEKELVANIRYLSTLKQQVEYWANAVQTYREEAEANG